MELKPDPELQRGILYIRATALAALFQHRAGHQITKNILCGRARINDVVKVTVPGAKEIIVGLIIESPGGLIFSEEADEATGLPVLQPPSIQAIADPDPRDLFATMPHADEVLRDIDPKRPSTWQRPDPAATAEQLMYQRVLVMGRDLFGEITGFVNPDDPTEGAFVKFEHPVAPDAEAKRVDFDKLRIPPLGL